LLICCSGVFMQADNAEQTAPGVGGLRGGESSAPTEDVLTQVGVHLHASRSSSQVSLVCWFILCGFLLYIKIRSYYDS